MNHIEEFNDFIRSEVNLNPNRLRELQRRVRAVDEFLSRNLKSYEKCENQGSHALGTIIRPVNDGEYDSDILLYLTNDPDKHPRDYVDYVFTCLKQNENYADKVQRKTRCVSVDFVGEFNLDIVPCITRGNLQDICNYRTDKFEPTDGTGYREWFNGKTDVTNGHLKPTTQLLKYIRDHKGNYEVPSILLTTFIGHSVHYNERGKRFKTLPDTLKTVSNRINSFLQATPNMPRMRNPARRGERFERHWDQKQYLHFREMFNIYNGQINGAFNETDRRSSLRKWRALFGDRFG